MKTLMSYLPDEHENSKETVTIQNAIQPELDLVWAARDDLLLQLNPNTATWGLVSWEDALGLTTDETKNLEYRRARVVAKLRGRGTTTVALLKEVAESIANSVVNVVEVAAEYRVEIHLDGTPEILSVLSELRESLDEIMPAHLEWGFVLRYRPQHHLYTGFAVRTGRHITVECAIPASLDVTYVVDEDGNLLSDENGARIID